MDDKDLLLQSNTNNNDEHLALYQPVDYIKQYRDSHKSLVMTGSDMQRNYTYDPANWKPLNTRKTMLGTAGMAVSDAVTSALATPAEFGNWARGGAVAFKKHFFPNMQEAEFERTYSNLANLLSQANEAKAEEIANSGHETLYDWVNAITNLGIYIAGGYAGAGIGAARLGASGVRSATKLAKGARLGAERAVGAMAGVQTTGQLATEFAGKYAEETGDYDLTQYNPAKDTALSGLLGGISAFVNSKLDVARYTGRFAKSAEKRLTKALAQGARGAVEEFTEESIESITQDLGRLASGYDYDLDPDDILYNALTNGLMGAVLGGVAGTGLYAINRRRMIKWYSDKGLDPQTSERVADQILDEGRSSILDEINTNYELAVKNGQAYEKLKGIYNKLYTSVDYEGLVEGTNRKAADLADVTARMTADWLTMHVDQYSLPTNLLIDINEAMDNMLQLRQFTPQDVKDRITSIKEEISAQKALGDASNTEKISDLKRKLNILTKVDNIYSEREASKKRAINNTILNNPDLSAEIENVWSGKVETSTPNVALAYFSKGDKDLFNKLMVKTPAKVKNALVNVYSKLNLTENPQIRAEISNALNKLETVNKQNFLNNMTFTENRDTTAENVILYNFVFEDQETINNFLSIYADNINNAGERSTKDILGQTLQTVDALKASTNPNYESKFGINGEMLDQNMLAAFMSYQNQFSTLNQIDSSLPEYTGETININGVEKTVYNSNGERIAKSEQALRNFYNWFGDSKVVDEQGRPLVVYHGTRAEWEIYDFNRTGESFGGFSAFKGGAYFTSSKDIAYAWGVKSKAKGEVKVMPVYLRLSNPKVMEYMGDYTPVATLKEQGFDGIIDKKTNHPLTDVVAFEENQIKSLYNIGTFSRDNNNIYYQSVFAKKADVSTKSDIKDMRKDAKKYLLDIIRKQDINHPKLGKIRVSRTGIDEFISHSNNKDKLALVPHLKELIETSNVGTEESPKHPRKDGIVSFIPLYNDAIVDNAPYNTKIWIGKDKDGNLFYDVKLENTEIGGVENQSTVDSDALNINITPENKKINKFLSQGKAVNGWYDQELQTIALGRSFNEFTLPHELAHHWLSRYFDLYKQYKNGTFKASKDWAQDAEQLFSMIGIDVEKQNKITKEQHEKWATMNEAYLSGFVPEELKNNISYRDFQQWIPEKYKSILQIGYLDKDNNIINPILSESDIDFFNKWYAHPDFSNLHVQPEAQKWAEKAASTKVMNDREKTIAQDWQEEEAAIKAMDRSRNDSIPTDLKAAIDSAEVLQNANDSQEFPTLPAHKSYLKFGAKDAQDRMADLAREYVEKNPEHATDIAFANPLFVENDTGIDREFLILAVIEKNNYLPNTTEYANLMHNAARTRQIAGSTLGLHNTNSFKWYIDAINQIEETLEIKAAINYAGRTRNALAVYNNDIEKFVTSRADKILSTAKDSKERNVALSAMFAEAKTKFSGNVSGTELTQLDLVGRTSTKNNKKQFIEWAKREIKRRAGVDITSEMQVELMQASQKAQLAEIELNNTDPAKAVAAAKTIREWQNTVNSYKKTSKGKVGRFFDSVFGEYAPRAMLFSPSTLAANIPSNVINTMITRIANTVYGKNKVSKDVLDNEINRLTQISRATGMNFATMEKPTSPSVLHGEKYKQTTGSLKWLDPFTYLSETDNLFRIRTFVDTLARIATRDAEQNNASPTDTFRQYAKLSNEKGSIAQQARLEAIEIGNIAVFTQNGMLAKMANKIRDGLNIVGTGTYGLGNLVSPFVKTPANIVEMGARALAFPVTSWKTILNWNSATDKAKFDFAMDGITLSVAVLATVLMSALQDDRDWYEEAYSGGKYDSNKPYDSIRFGNTWIRLDQFGTLMLPIQVGAKLVKELQKDTSAKEVTENTAWQVFSEILRQTPVIDTFQENSMKWAASHPADFALNWGYNQANKLVPAWAKQIARPVIRESGIVINPESKIGNRAVRNYGLDGQDNTINDWISIIYGRLKVEQ